MYNENILKFFMSYLLVCSVLFTTARCAQPSIVPHNLHHVVPKNEDSHTRHQQCRLICSNQFGGVNGSQTQSLNQSSSTGRQDLPLILQNLSNFPGNSTSLVGLVFNRTGGFRGLVKRISNLRDVIQGFPHSSAIIITRLEQLRENPFLRGLLQFGGRLYNNEGHIISEGLEQVAGRRVNLQDVFRKLPNITGIFSSPVGIIFNPFHIRLGNLSPSNIISQFRSLFHRLPSLSGVFLRPNELFNFNHHSVSLTNSGGLFFGPERGYLILKTVFGRILSQLNLNRSTSSAHLFRVLPFLTDVFKHLPKINTTDNEGTTIINSFLNLGQILNNSSLLNELIHEPFQFHEIPEAVNYQETYILRLIENIFLSLSGNSDQSAHIRELINRFALELNQTLNFESTPLRFLNATNWHPLINILQHFVKAFGNGNANTGEIINRLSYEVNNLHKILSSGRFANNTTLRPLLNILRYFEGAAPGDLDINKIIIAFSYELNNLYNALSSGNARFLNGTNLRPFLNILHHFEEAVGNGSSGNLKINEIIKRVSYELSNFSKVLSSGNSSAILSSPFVNILHYFEKVVGHGGTGNLTISEIIKRILNELNNFSKILNSGNSSAILSSPFFNIFHTFAHFIEDAIAQTENSVPGCAENSTESNSPTRESRYRKPHKYSSTSKSTTASSGKTNKTPSEGGNHIVGTGGNGNGGPGSGSIGVGGAGINEKSAKKPYQHRIKSHEKYGSTTAKPPTNKNRGSVVGTGGNGSGGAGSGSIGIGGAGINEKSAKHPSEHKIKSHEKHGTTAKPSTNKDGGSVIGTGGNGNGGAGSGSIGIGGAGINEKSAKHPSEHRKKSHEKYSTTAKPSTTKDGGSVVGTGGNGSGGAGSGSIGIGGAGINEKSGNQPSQQKSKPHTEHPHKEVNQK